jgi:hypothetical protein
MACGLTDEDIVFEVRRARRLGLDRVELRKRLACPCCTGGEAFLPGPVLARVEVEWPAGVARREQVAQVAARCLAQARALGIPVAAE